MNFYIVFAAKQPDELAIFIGIIAFVILAIACICHLIYQQQQKMQEEKKDAVARENYKKWRIAVSQKGSISCVPTSICLSAGERCYLVSTVTLCETRAVRNSTHTGGAVHLAKGLTVGQGYTTSESHDEWRAISHGKLYVTNTRILFDGDMQNRSIKMKDLLSVDAAPRQLAISTTTRKKTMVFKGINGQIARDIINILRRNEA